MGNGGLIDSIQGFGGFTLILAILGLGLLVAFHELGHHLVALWTGMRVRRFSIGLGPAIFTRTHKGVDYTIGAIPFGGFVDVVGLNPLEDGALTDPQSYQRRPRWARALMVAAGPLFNYALAWVMFVGMFAFGGLKQDLEYKVLDVVKGSAAEQVGLQKDDVVTQVGGKTLGRHDTLSEVVGASTGKPLPLTVRRGDEILTFSPVPQGEPGAGKLGIMFDPVAVGPASNYGIGESMGFATNTIVFGTVRILEDVGRMFRQRTMENVGGPVEMVRQLEHQATKGMKDLLFMLAMLSVMLGLFNLFPIPPLDGSKLLMLGVEGVARREIPAKVHVVVQGLGMVAMLGLLTFVTVRDINRPGRMEPEKEAVSKEEAAPAKPAAEEPAPAEAPAP